MGTWIRGTPRQHHTLNQIYTLANYQEREKGCSGLWTGFQVAFKTRVSEVQGFPGNIAELLIVFVNDRDPH